MDKLLVKLRNDKSKEAGVNGIDINRVKELLKENNIKYIVIDDKNRNSQFYILSEQFFADNFRVIIRFHFFEPEHGHREVQEACANQLVIYQTE